MPFFLALILFTLALKSEAQDAPPSYVNRAIAYDVILQASVEDAKIYNQKMKEARVKFAQSQAIMKRVTATQNFLDSHLDQATPQVMAKNNAQIDESVRLLKKARTAYAEANVVRQQEVRYLQKARNMWDAMRLDPAFAIYYKLTYRYFSKSLVDDTNRRFHPDELYGITGKGKP